MKIRSSHPHARFAMTALSQLAGKTFVIKYGGNAISDNALHDFAQDIALLHAYQIKLIVVHGGGPQVDDMLAKIGHTSTRIDGMRVTDPITMDVAEMVLGANVNGKFTNLINHYCEKGVAVGLNGKDGQLLVADKLMGDVDLGLVGDIKKVNTHLLNMLLNNNIIPIIAPIATNETSDITYNINADMVASEIAKALNADELLLLSNIDGVLNKQKNLLHTLTLKDIEHLIHDGTIYGGMIPKIDGAVKAIKAGVKSIRILNGEKENALIEMLIGGQMGSRIIKK